MKVKALTLFFDKRIYVLGIFLFASCSQYSNAPLSKSWHNTNAKFNAYLMAIEDLKGAKIAIFENRQENYQQVLPILLPIDSTQNTAIRPLLDDAIQKASLVAERHQNSKWLDNAYLVIGESRLLKQDYNNAIEVFKFVNTKGRGIEEKHQALILLMRAYIEQGDTEGVLRVAEVLRTQDLSKSNAQNFYLTKAYYHQKNQEFELSVAILEEALKLMKRREETARIHYIAGQLYESLKKPTKAFEHFELIEKNKPSYELSFNGQMNALLNQAGNGKGSLRAVQAYFDEMLKDRKNSDLQDKIYLTMGRLEVQQQNYKKGLALFRKAAQQAKGNGQGAFAYLETAELYYNKFQDYTHAQAYYDSALAVLPPQHALYASVKKRQKTLSDFVKYYNIVRVEDSLQAVVKLPLQEINELVDKRIAQQDEQERKRLDAANQLANKEQRAGFSGNMKDRWVLYDPIAIQNGRSTFRQTWGSRTLEDNWRRSTKNEGGMTALADNANKTALKTALLQTGQSLRKTVEERKKELLAELPSTPEAFESSRKRQEIAYYQVGKIYQLQLNETSLAKKYFESLLAKFPKTVYEPEVLYLLALHTPEPYKQQLIDKYPHTSFTRLAQKNAQAQAGNDAEGQAQQLYATAFGLYEKSNYALALSNIEQALTEYSGVKIEDKMAMLRILLLSKTQQKDSYVQALNDFPQSYPNSPLLPRVKEMIEIVRR